MTAQTGSSRAEPLEFKPPNNSAPSRWEIKLEIRAGEGRGTRERNDSLGQLREPGIFGDLTYPGLKEKDSPSGMDIF